MELKLNPEYDNMKSECLLIVPYGIETEDY